ncbi:MAG: radical SAM protein [Candidatus Aminicenantes bacterium]|jgi:DNA repair photolyase
MARYGEKEFKTILNKLKYIDSWFWARYTINPYSGCEHACLYCDARSEKYYLHHDLDNEIYVKKDVKDKLDKRLENARTLLPDVVALGGVCDAYQPAEAIYKNTRQILEVLDKHKYPVCLSTKSELVLRDLDLYSKIAGETHCTVSFTITTFNRNKADFFEPVASSPDTRIKALERIKNKYPQIQTGVNFIPIIPFIEDSDENLEEVVSLTKTAGCDFILFAPGMTLRDSQARFFISKMKESMYRDELEKILELYRGNMYPNSRYFFKINRKMLELCEKYNLSFRAQRYIPEDYRRCNYIIAKKLLDQAYFDQITGKPWSATHWAGLHLQNLKESILDVYKRGELKTLKNFTHKVIKYVEPYLRVSGFQS